MGHEEDRLGNTRRGWQLDECPVHINRAANAWVLARGDDGRDAAERVAEHSDAVRWERAGSAGREQLGHGGCVTELVEDEGGVCGAGVDMRRHGGEGLRGVVVVDGVAGGVGDYVGVAGVVDGEDCEALAGDGGGEDAVEEAGNAVAGGEEEDGGVSRGWAAAGTHREAGEEEKGRKIGGDVEDCLEERALV